MKMVYKQRWYENKLSVEDGETCWWTGIVSICPFCILSCSLSTFARPSVFGRSYPASAWAFILFSIYAFNRRPFLFGGNFTYNLKGVKLLICILTHTPFCLSFVVSSPVSFCPAPFQEKANRPARERKSTVPRIRQNDFFRVSPKTQLQAYPLKRIIS